MCKFYAHFDPLDWFFFLASLSIHTGGKRFWKLKHSKLKSEQMRQQMLFPFLSDSIHFTGTFYWDSNYILDLTWIFHIIACVSAKVLISVFFLIPISYSICIAPPPHLQPLPLAPNKLWSWTTESCSTQKLHVWAFSLEKSVKKVWNCLVGCCCMTKTHTIEETSSPGWTPYHTCKTV